MGRAAPLTRRNCAGRLAVTLVAATALAAVPALDAPELTLPLRDGSVRFAAIGDGGTGSRAQRDVGARMAEYHAAFPFEFVIMMGDNIYGDERPEDFVRKFERPYRALLDAGVKFFASLGNHDEPAQRYYARFNMKGRRYYSFVPPQGGVRFFALDSTYMDAAQLAWLAGELAAATERWKICFFHHPIYSSGARHGPDLDLRRAIEPLFVEHGVDVVFSGHEHFYERLRPQRGVHYFISGAAGRLRRGNIRMTPQTAQGFDRSHSFMLIEIAGDELHFQVVSREGATVDRGMIRDPR